jgi:sarcosine oxidase subunit alpha
MPRLPGFDTDCIIRFDGDAVPARRGEPVAAALLAAGRVVLSRSAKYHRPRGAFCLASSCAGCLVRVDGLPSQRACRTPCRDGLAVETQNAIPGARHDLLGAIDVVTPRGLDHHHLATFGLAANRAAIALSRRLAGVGRLPDAAALGVPGGGPVPEERVDVLVVGAGPAGLAAAEALAEAGRRILLADEAPAPGGRLRAKLEPAGAPDLAWAGRVLARVAAAGGEAAIGSAVVGLWHDGGTPLALVEVTGPPRGLRLVRAGRVVLCPGGHPQPLEAPGGDRPGVLAGRGVAAALAEHGVVPGARAAVLGEGPEAAALADRLAGAGMAVERVGAAQGGRVVGCSRIRALALPGRRIRCDTLAVAAPPAPATELARVLGASIAFDAGIGAFAVRAAADGATEVPGLFAAGEITGAIDAARAADAGRRAGEAARG